MSNANAPTLRCGEALVVYDGPRRLIWHQTDATKWTPLRLWPDSTEAATVAKAIARGDPILIILDLRPEPIHALVDELAAVPPEIADLVCSVSGDVAELRIPRLTWLPSDLTARGEAFLRSTAASAAHTPALLLPGLLLQSPYPATDNVWFGLRVRNVSWSIDELMAVTDGLTAEPTHAARLQPVQLSGGGG